MGVPAAEIEGVRLYIGRCTSSGGLAANVCSEGTSLDGHPMRWPHSLALETVIVEAHHGLKWAIILDHGGASFRIGLPLA